MPTPSQINLIKNAKINFLLVKKFKSTESAQLCTSICYPFEMMKYIQHIYSPN